MLLFSTTFHLSTCTYFSYGHFHFSISIPVLSYLYIIYSCMAALVFIISLKFSSVSLALKNFITSTISLFEKHSHKNCCNSLNPLYSECVVSSIGFDTPARLSSSRRAGVLKPLEDITYNKTVKWVELELRDFCECYSKRGIADVIKMMCKLQGCQMKI